LKSVAYGTNGYRLEAYASAPLRYTSPQVKVLHCLTVKGQEARRKGVAARRGLRHRSARWPVRNASEHDSARQAGEPASKWAKPSPGRRTEREALAEHGKGWPTRACRVVGGGMGIKV